MDRKTRQKRSQKSNQDLGTRSAFEVSLKLEFQVETLPREAARPKAGQTCPDCQSAKIDYDEMLNLSCPNCSYTLAGCFT